MNARVIKEYSCDFTAVFWDLYDIMIATARAATLEKVLVIHIGVCSGRESAGGNLESTGYVADVLEVGGSCTQSMRRWESNECGFVLGTQLPKVIGW